MGLAFYRMRREAEVPGETPAPAPGEPKPEGAAEQAASEDAETKRRGRPPKKEAEAG